MCGRIVNSFGLVWIRFSVFSVSAEEGSLLAEQPGDDSVGRE